MVIILPQGGQLQNYLKLDDLSKAFDRVWHRGLLAKMEHLGVTGKALNWVAGYLQDRRQKVQLEEASSSWQSIPAGVPQGSILGPLFFLIYTHDLPDAVEAGVECDQFADDTALLSIHSNRDAAVANMQLGVNDTRRVAALRKVRRKTTLT